ncbi:MAG: hypothetical protein Q4F72_11220, partial [Desulfovibrionaceae bacterium]|nr:hypothetical protein [Desulfovibrionaceae bacterium]
MNEKIDWYREVLEIEPQARLFYPLAKLLIEDGRPLEACDVLARGLVHHPAYMEARMCYAELLATLGRDEACREQIDLLSGILSGRAGFWQAWAERAGGDADAGLAMRCLSLVLRGVPVSFSDLMRRGLESLEAEYEQSVPADEAAVSAAACGAAARQAAAIIAAAGAAGHLAPAAPEPEESAAASTARAEAGEPAEESPVSASLAAHLAEHRARLLNEAAPAGPEPEALDEDAAPEAEAGSEELSAGGHLPGFEALSAFTASMDSARDDGEAAGQPEEEQSAEAAALAAKAAAAVARLAAAEEAEAGDAEDSGEAALAEEPAAAMPPESGESGEAEAAEEAGFEAAVACALA